MSSDNAIKAVELRHKLASLDKEIHGLQDDLNAALLRKMQLIEDLDEIPLGFAERMWVNQQEDGDEA